MSKPIAKPHRLRVWAILPAAPGEGIHEPYIEKTHDAEYPSKGAADCERRAQRAELGMFFSSATVEPL